MTVYTDSTNEFDAAVEKYTAQVERLPHCEIVRNSGEGFSGPEAAGGVSVIGLDKNRNIVRRIDIFKPGR